jgi:hypothetical protein
MIVDSDGNTILVDAVGLGEPPRELERPLAQMRHGIRNKR